ncbi:MAG: aldehyde reductase [Pseudomonadota bacterium]
MAGETVLVTGATGFIASHVVLALLKKGYKVRGTARSASSGSKLNQTLSDFAGEPIDIEIFEADLRRDEGWAEAVQGCAYVHHVASPIPAKLPRDENELIVPARDGALRVLKASKAAGVRRVVLTSSVVAIAYGRAGPLPDQMDETNWTDPEILADNNAYSRSKVFAERAAWDYVKGEGQGLELTTVHPAAVLGPVMSGDFSTSLEVITQLMGGKLPAVPKMGFQLVDVRDVADLHVLAMQAPEAAGERFIAAEEFFWFSDLAEELRAAYPSHAKKIPKGQLPNGIVRLLSTFNPVLKQVAHELGKKRVVSNEKAKRMLGWKPIPAIDAAKASADSLIKHGVV